MINRIEDPSLRTTVRSGGRSQTSKDGKPRTYGRLAPPEDVIWLKLPNFAKIKQLWRDGELILPRSYRPGMYLNVIV